MAQKPWLHNNLVVNWSYPPNMPELYAPPLFSPSCGQVSFKEFAAQVNLGGGRLLEKAITTAMEASGRLKGVMTLQEQFDRRKAQAKGEADPEKLKILEQKLAALGAKIAAVAIQEEKALFRAFRQMDTDGSGSLDREELAGALKALNLGVAKVDGIFTAMGGGAEGDAGITFAQFKDAVKLGGGKSFEKALTSKVMVRGEWVSGQLYL